MIEREINFGSFDPNELTRYRNWLFGIDRPAHELPPPLAPPLSALWQQYMTVKCPGKSPSTIREYEDVNRLINRLPTDDLTQPQAILDTIGLLPADRQRRFLTQINACAKWAVKSGLIESNPFMGTARAVKVHQQGTTEDEIRPFSRAERDRIIEAFRHDVHYSHYADLVAFLFFTGARPSEVVPMQWYQVRADHILFNQSRVYTGRGYQTKNGLKTQQSRRFPVNPQLRDIIGRFKSNAQSGADCQEGKDLVFPSPTLKPIHWSNFTRRAWKGVLKTLPEIEYRNPYQMRHSFISYCREANLPSTTISEWVGNSAEMIDRVYARSTKAFTVPEL